MMQCDHGSPHGAVYPLLDDLRAAQVVPVGALGAIYPSIDQLRSSQAPAEVITPAEKISLAMLCWDSARPNGDSGAEDAARAFLETLRVTWMETRLPSSMTVALPTAQSELSRMELNHG